MNAMRWLNDLPADGVTNMARDEALLEQVGAGQSPATLRFYRWTPATISLGYFQCYADYEALEPPAGQLPVVRRQTGGGAILHDRELTYSLVLPLEHPWLTGFAPSVLYTRVHLATARVLAARGIHVGRGPVDKSGCSHGGPFFCFAQHCCFDLVADGRKMMGSAQRRTRSAVLQHGSLILDSRFKQQPCTSVVEHGVPPEEDGLIRDLVREITGESAGTQGSYSVAELERAEQLKAKYADPAWLRRR